MMVRLPVPHEVIFKRTKLGVEDILDIQCGGRGSHCWVLAIWELGPAVHARNCMPIM